MENRDDCFSTQIIDVDGTFNVDGLNNFEKQVKLAECGNSYAVVAIMGPQSTGKSTLLNHLFGTNFQEMDAFKGRSRTTTGVWMAHCVGIEPCTLVMDLEGSDGRERGEAAFAKQSALFALAVSNIVLINMWCHDVGHERAANKPLLKAVFQVMMKMFSPRKTSLMFVIRDKTKTPLEILEPILREDIRKIWDSVPKLQAHKETPLSEFFNVEVVALSSYEQKEELFKEEVANLRQRFYHSIAPGGLSGDKCGVVTASRFAFSAQQTWKVIKENKDLDLPAQKAMVATVRCEEIANEKFSSFTENEEWCHIKKRIQSEPVLGFGRKLTFILDNCLSGYDVEATYFDEGVRSSKREQLEEKLLHLVQPSYQHMLRHKCSRTLEQFKKAFDSALKDGKGFAVASRDCTKCYMSKFDEASADVDIARANWDNSKVRDKLERDIDAHIAAVRGAKLFELNTVHEKKLHEALAVAFDALLDEASDYTWSKIREVLRLETKAAVGELSSALSGFEMDDVTKEEMISRLEDYGSGAIEAKAREGAAERLVLNRMKDRFDRLFSLDSDSKPRIWRKKADIRAMTRTARIACLKILAVLAAVCLDDHAADSIGNTMSLALIGPESGKADTRRITRRILGDPLAPSRWEEVLPSKTLISPVQCKSIWNQFIGDTQFVVSQAIAAQKAYRRNNKCAFSMGNYCTGRFGF